MTEFTARLHVERSHLPAVKFILN